MCGDSRPIRPTCRDDDPGRDGQRIPPAVADDLTDQSGLLADLSDHLVDVDDVRLELDHEDGPPARMPGDDVDDTAPRVEYDTSGAGPGGSSWANQRATSSWSCECLALSNRSRSPARQRGTRSTRTSRAAATRRRVSSENVPGCPRSSREIVARETPDRLARSACVHRRLILTARIADPNRWSSMRRSVAAGPSPPVTWQKLRPRNVMQ